MTNPSRRGGGNNLRSLELRSRQVAEALGVTYKIIYDWTDHGLASVQSFRRGTREPACGQGSVRLFTYPNILQLALVRSLHCHNQSLDAVGLAISQPPSPYEETGWGQLIADYNPGINGEIFHCVVEDNEPLDLITDEQELLGALVSTVATTCINLGALKYETDIGIRSVLQTA